MTEILANPLIAAAGTAIGGTIIALWLAAAWWAYRDAARRAELSLAAFLAAGWIVLSTPLLLPMSLVIYRVARPQVTAADQRARTLAHELAATITAGPACTGCGIDVEPSWIRCPACATWLGTPCASCGAWSDPSFDICPWCAADTGDGPTVVAPDRNEPIEQPAAAAAAAARRRRPVAWPPFGSGRPTEHGPTRRPLARA